MTGRRAVAAIVLVAALPLAACTAGDEPLTLDQTKAAELTAEQLAVLGGVPTTDSDIPDYTAADLVGVALSPEVVDPEPCREYVESIAVPGQVVLTSRDAESADAVVVSAHLDLDPGFVEQAFRVLPDAATAEELVADLRGLAETCDGFEYGAASNINRFATVETGDLPFDGDGYRSVLTVKGTKYVVETEDVFVMRFANVVATVRGTAGETEPFARTVAENLRAQG